MTDDMKTLTPKELANEWGVSPKTLRKFLRSENRAAEAETPGKGGRWVIPEALVIPLRARFDTWMEAKAARVIEIQVAEDDNTLDA